MAVLNPHLGVTNFPTDVIPRTQSSGLWDIRNETYSALWSKSTLQFPYGRRGWEFCAESEISAWMAQYTAGTPSFFNYDEKSIAASYRSAYLSSGWICSGMGSLGNLGGGFEPGQAWVNAGYAALENWRLRATGSATSGYEDRLAATLLSYVNNSNNDCLTGGAYQGGGSTGGTFHSTAQHAMVLQIQTWCLQDLIDSGRMTAAQGIAVQTRLQRFAWRVALDASWWLGKYDFADAGNWAKYRTGDYSMAATASANCNVDTGEGDSRTAYLVRAANGTQYYPNRWSQGSQHAGGNQFIQPISYVGLVGLATNNNALVAEWQRMVASAIAYQQTKEGFGWDQMRLTTQDGMTNGGNPGGGGYHYEIHSQIAGVTMVMHRLGRTDTPLNWEFDTGLPAGAYPNSAGVNVAVPSTFPDVGQKKKLKNVWDWHRDTAGGVTRWYACDGTSNVPPATLELPPRAVPMRSKPPSQWDAQWIASLGYYAHALPAESYDKPVRRVAPYNQGNNADSAYWPSNKQLNQAWAPGFPIGHLPCFPMPGIQMRSMYLSGTPSFDGTLTGVNLFSSSPPATGTQNKILSVTNTPGQTAWTAQVETISGGTVQLIAQDGQPNQTPVSVASGVRSVSGNGPEGRWKLALIVGGTTVDLSDEYTFSPPFLDLTAPTIDSVNNRVNLNGSSFGHSTPSAWLQAVDISENPTGEFTLPASIGPALVGPARTIQTITGAIAITAAVAGKRARWLSNADGGGDSVSPSIIVATAGPPPVDPPPPPPPPASYTWATTGFSHSVPSSTVFAAGTTNAPTMTAYATRTGVAPAPLSVSLNAGAWTIAGTLSDGTWGVYAVTPDGVSHFIGLATTSAIAYVRGWTQSTSGARPTISGYVYGFPAITASLALIDGTVTIPTTLSAVVTGYAETFVTFTPVSDVAPGVYTFFTINGGDQPALGSFTWGSIPDPGDPPAPAPIEVLAGWDPQALWLNPDQTAATIHGDIALAIRAAVAKEAPTTIEVDELAGTAVITIAPGQSVAINGAVTLAPGTTVAVTGQTSHPPRTPSDASGFIAAGGSSYTVAPATPTGHLVSLTNTSAGDLRVSDTATFASSTTGLVVPAGASWVSEGYEAGIPITTPVTVWGATTGQTWSATRMV